ncbi:MAG: hydrogenase iron-sulfur subunit [Deltaproteobacteria bacterium]|nr:hydrogenase iron-sulfur subunit [Deltaproteobacteria bacterium]MBW2069639.1 hydrogenase iron-sulfur subunit [Deltaproteobacteria bacterium]
MSKMQPYSLPRIGVYVCHCGHNIAGAVDVAAVREFAAGLKNVHVARDHVFCCAEPGQLEIQDDIRQHGLNRIVVAACSPRLHEPTFRRTIKEAGLNPYLLEMANIREHCSWVHFFQGQQATAKAKDLVAMAVARVTMIFPLTDRRVPVLKRALVVGGGPAGLQAALDLADTGYPVLLVERSPFLGGMLNDYWRIFPQGEMATCLITPLKSRVLFHPLVEVATSSEVVSVSGHIGNYQVEIHTEPRYVDSSCDLCGKCSEVCTTQRDKGGDKAIYLPNRLASPPLYAIDGQACSRCGDCVEACPRGAIDLQMKPIDKRMEVGTIILATGFQPYDPLKTDRYPYAGLPNVVTSVELERMLDPEGSTGGCLRRPSDGKPVERVAFLQCVGSREQDGNRYCSRVCCMVTLKQAHILKAERQVDVTVYYSDIRALKKTYEDLYAAVRSSGVLFYRGRIDRVVSPSNGALQLHGYNELLQTATLQEVDLLVLALGMEANGNAGPLKEVLKLSVGDDGFFLEAHPKLRPLETALDGIFLAGTCQGPKDISETIAHASGAAAKAGTLLAHEQITLDGIIARIDLDECVGCQKCVQKCPFHAVHLVEVEGEKKAAVIAAACKGCGVCAGECPTGAAQLLGYTDEQLVAQVQAALREEADRKVVVFACNWCSYAGADFAGVSRLQYPENVRIIRVPCSGRVSERLIMEALRLGAASVLVSGCHPPGDCHYISGNLRALARVQRLRSKLPKKNIDPQRLQLEWISATEGNKFQAVVERLCQQARGNQRQSPG